VLLFLKEYLGEDYRDITEFLELMTPIRDQMDLQTVPHFTTIQKFMARIPVVRVQFHPASDSSSGLQLGRGDPDHRDRFKWVYEFLCEFLLFLEDRQAEKTFIKTSIAVDTEQQNSIGFTNSRNPVHGIPHAETLESPCHWTRRSRQRVRAAPSACHVMDKGYDSEELHRLIRHRLEADSVIPVRNRPRTMIHGRYRQQLA
jgi:hypothetical protein